MGKDTSIGWCHHTFNIAWGCTKVSAGCANCYAEGQSSRWGYDVWGGGSMGKRRTFGKAHWMEPLSWNAAAEKAGVRRRVFCSSMCDVFEDHPVINEERQKLWSLIDRTPWLDWQILTKRADRLEFVTQFEWRNGPSPMRNVWLGVSVEDQATADERIPHLLTTPATVRFVSYEPALGAVDFDRIRFAPIENAFVPALSADRRLGCLIVDHRDRDASVCFPRLDWIIVGGESGPGARPFDIAWARSTVAQCAAAGLPVFVKQLGARPVYDAAHMIRLVSAGLADSGVRDAKGGSMAEWPEDLRVRQFPEARA